MGNNKVSSNGRLALREILIVYPEIWMHLVEEHLEFGVNLLFLTAGKLVEYLGSFNFAIIHAVRGIHHVVDGNDFKNGRGADTEESCASDVSLITRHEH